jgi:hypothetical protein
MSWKKRFAPWRWIICYLCIRFVPSAFCPAPPPARIPPASVAPRRNPSEPGLPKARERPKGGLKMGRHMLGALMFGLALLAGEAWAIVGADTGGIWVQALWKDKVELTNIISLEKRFQDPANRNKTIIEAAQECQTENPQ